MFERGQIVRLKCENVLTYHNMEIFPCEKLNLIIGANGTGKSTIISAIILGLGGTATLVGRGKDLKQYVKLGQRNAKIEIELFHGKKNYIVERHFDTNGNSRFFINGKSETQEKVARLAFIMKIQIDNLCQILPQEKLEEFARMNDHDRLVGTLKTVGDTKLSAWLEELKSGKDTEAEMRHKLVVYKNELIEKVNTRDSMEGVFKAVKEKIFLIDCLKLIKQRRAWQFYFHMQQTVNIVNGRIKNKQASYQKMVGILKNVMAEVQASYSNVATIKEKSKYANNKLVILVKEVKTKQNKISVTADEINAVKNAFKQKENRYKTQEQDVKALKDKIEKIKLDMASNEDTEKKINVLSNSLDRLQIEMRSEHRAKEITFEELNNKRNELTATEYKLSKLNNVQERKMRILENYHLDCYKGMKWLEKHRDLFKGEVFGPMFLYLNVNGAENAKYVEMCIGRRDLIAFFCEYREDTEILIKELRERQKLRISIVSALTHVPDVSPPYSIESLRPLGFHAFVRDFISGPQLIVDYLTVSYKLHCVPVGNSHTYKVTDQVPPEFKVFFTDKLRFQTNVVPLTGQKIESSREIVDARYLSVSADFTELNELQHTQQEIERQVKDLEETFRVLSERVAAGDGEIRQLRQDIHKMENLKMTRSRLQDILKQKVKEYNQLQNSVIDLDLERNSCNLEIKVTLAKVCNLYIELSDLFQKVSEAFIEFQKHKADIEQMERVHKKNLFTSAELVKKLKEESSSLRKLDHRKKQLQICTKAIYDWALKATRCDPRKPEFERRKLFFLLTENVVILNKLIDRFQAKINCLGDENNGLKVFRDYKEVARAIEFLEKKIQKYETKLQTHYQDLDHKKEQWLIEVKELIEKVDNNFRKFFEMMNCAGAVSLYQGDSDDDDFKKYGIHVKVKFRKEGELQILNSQTQSGGERAVSIAIYLLSLQELTTVPFRCIDEINQGMDADNERRIFNLISKATEELGKTQYFLLTPKLLPNLNFTPHCKIFFPYNGVGSLPHDEFSQYMVNRQSKIA